jgi:hypothetical protein
MKYMLLIYNRPGFLDTVTEAERTELFGQVDAIMADLTASGELVGGQALADPRVARTVRAGTGGAPFAVTDGPFIESKEQFAGYIEVDCASAERAEEIAGGWPDVRFGGAMEVRAVLSGGAEDI